MSNKVSITELSRMTITELRKELQVKRAELAKMRMGLTMQSEKNHAQYKVQKKDVARMSMVMMQLEKKGQTQTAAEPSQASEKKTIKKKPSQTAKKSVKRSGSRTKKA
jgi:ribosomal protein L29